MKGLNDEKSNSLKLRMYTNASIILQNKLKFNEAINFYKKALNLAENLSDLYLIEELNYKLGMCYYKLGSLVVSREYFQQSYIGALEIGDTIGIINNLNYFGLISKRKEMYDSARLSFRSILEIPIKRNKKVRYWGMAYHNIGASFVNEENLDSARKYYKKAIAIKTKNKLSSTIYKNKSLLLTFLDLAEVEIKSKEYLVAMGYLNYVLDSSNMMFSESLIKEDFNYLNSIMKVYSMKGECLEKLYKDGDASGYLTDANDNYLEALKLINDSRQKFRTFQEIEILNKQYNAVFNSIVDLNYRLYTLTNDREYLHSTFRYVENAKSFGLFQSLNRNQAIESAGVPDSIIMEIDRLNNMASFYSSQIEKIEQKQVIDAADSTRLIEFSIDKTKNEESLKDLMKNLDKICDNLEC